MSASVAVEAVPAPSLRRKHGGSCGRLAAFVLPAAFIVGVAATLVVALHDPHPHDMALTVAGLASTGGASPTSMLPGLFKAIRSFWFFQAIHSFWFGSGAFGAIRDVVYFPGASATRWIVQLNFPSVGGSTPELALPPF